MQPMAIYSPWHLGSSEPPDLSSPAYRFLAEGDSWFSIGALNPAKNSNLLFEMAFEQSACAVNCAAPGDTLRRMSQISTDRNFVELLCGRRARIWDGLLLSCGGNDLIDALQARGTQIPPDRRLLLDRNRMGPGKCRRRPISQRCRLEDIPDLFPGESRSFHRDERSWSVKELPGIFSRLCGAHATARRRWAEARSVVVSRGNGGGNSIGGFDSGSEDSDRASGHAARRLRGQFRQISESAFLRYDEDLTPTG